MSADRQPGLRSSAFCVAGIGPVSMITGSAPASAAVWKRASGVEAQLGGLLRRGDQQRRGAVGDLRGVAGGDTPSSLNAGLERGQLLERGPAPDALVGGDDVPSAVADGRRSRRRSSPSSCAAAARSCDRGELRRVGARTGPTARRSSRR